MSTTAATAANLPGEAFGFWRRLIALAVVLGSEALLASIFADGAMLSQRHGALTGNIRIIAPWALRFAIAFVAIFTVFALMRDTVEIERLSKRIAQEPINAGLAVAHAVSIAVFSVLSAVLYGNGLPGIQSDLIAAAWISAVVMAALTAAFALIPVKLWSQVLRSTGKLWLYSVAGAAVACYAGMMSWILWQPVTRLTFVLVRALLHPVIPDLIVQPLRMRLVTGRFAVTISPECSGLEGMALLLVFGVLWMLLFRKEIRFPHSLLLLAAGVVILYFLNVARIAALLLIGHAGAPRIAAGGFHSQAGWIAFSCVAFGLTIAARRLSWFSVRDDESEGRVKESDNPAAPWLLPFLAILAAGMLSHAVSGGFEWLYSLRLFAALAALWFYRRCYTGVDWRFGSVGPLVGVLVFLIWIGIDRAMGNVPQTSTMPVPLAESSSAVRILWIVLRAAAAIITVPVAEELAFRGFLLRRFIAADFENVRFGAFTWFSVLASSVAFGLLHGGRWVAGIAAGCLYAYALLHRGRLGDAIIAHATTNALLALYVIWFGQWYLW